ncbi:MAG: hypothetical protein J7L39_02195 [Candidatus Aenigmarchaeota archaeon]|nr:hypothetical protein [Candidatus Aenigmarchaeota archaeon]
MKKLRILVLGNPLIKKDSLALEIAKEISDKFSEVEFVEFDPIEELETDVPIFMDVVMGLEKVKLIEGEKFEVDKRFSLHDFGLEHLIELLKKLGRLKKVKVIGIPPDYPKEKAKKEVESILKSILSLKNGLHN